MRVIDISQEVLDSRVFPYDSKPSIQRVSEMSKGAEYNLTDISMCLHNGTHIDAPFHFIDDGNTIDKISLESCIGPCSIVEMHGVIKADDIMPVLEYCKPRLLIKGDVEISSEAAECIGNQLILIGVEGVTVGSITSPAQVHRILLGNNIVIIEGLELSGVSQGEYFLSAAPLNVKGCDGAPCRAVLICD